MKPIKCWYCENLAKCEVLVPCENFKKYYYGKKGTRSADFVKRLAKEQGVTVRTIYRRLKKANEKILK